MSTRGMITAERATERCMTVGVSFLQVNAAVSRRLMSKVVKAIYVPPGNWGKAAIKVNRIVRLKRKMAKLMEKMSDILKEFKSYSKPNRTVIAVSAALGLLTEGAPQVLEQC